MRVIEGRLILNATDLSRFLACDHLTQLELLAARGERLPRRVSEMTRLLGEFGARHEEEMLRRYEHQGLSIKRFSDDVAKSAATVVELEDAAHGTEQAMRDGYDVIYQPVFFDGEWLGRADFLCKVARPSALGAHSYEVADAKLARHVRAEALLQLSEYSRHVARLQGVSPEWMHLLLGDGTDQAHLVSDFSAYHENVRRQLLVAVADGRATYPMKVPHCGICEYADHCDARRHDDDHLSTVARMRRDQLRKLESEGVRTVAQLAVLSPEVRIPRLQEATLEGLRCQASLQVRGRTLRDAVPLVELIAESTPGFGLAALPPPSRGDVFFDMEGDPLARDPALEYLFGAVTVDKGAPEYQRWLGHDAAEERRAFEQFIDWVMQRLETYPNMHIYHYAPYERTALLSLMGRHATRETQIDMLLRRGVLVDLYRVVRQGIRLSAESYGLKEVERLYMAPREESVSDAEGSVVAYERWLCSGETPETREQHLLDEIVEYNRVDCTSTWMLREWLEGQRENWERTFGEPLPRPSPRETKASEQLEDATSATEDLRRRLTEDIPDEPEHRSDAQQATWLLAQLLGYHRREDKVEWWRYFGQLEMTHEELEDDAYALGPLRSRGPVDNGEAARVFRYTFEPQEHKIREQAEVKSLPVPEGHNDAPAAGRVVDIDNVQGVVDIRRPAKSMEGPEPEFLISGGPIGRTGHAKALREVGEWVHAHGIDALGAHRAARDLLLRLRPRLRSGHEGPLRQPGESAEEAAVRVGVEQLDHSCLPIQGPPGAGKTYTAARVAVQLARRGRRVAVTATAHKAIANLLDEAADAARESNESFGILQRGGDGDWCSDPDVLKVEKTDEVVAALSEKDVRIVGGTTWLWVHEAVAGAFDTLIVDEAGQMSLADVVAVSRCAQNIVLVGDPRQLAQVVQGAHPKGSAVSALEHLLGNELTVGEDRGIFLDRTWRMAPAVCSFVSTAFYEDRLHPVETCEQQAILMREAELTGLRLHSVAHTSDRTYSEAEASAVAGMIRFLLQGSWRDQHGAVRRLTLNDILVVAPYNAHVACLQHLLPTGARVGTVDKFQGQEAAVSIFSMATSSTDDLPRNLEFLYSMNRLNVAVSRARCLSVLVCSPQLLSARCHTPEQMRLVNALCRYEQMALSWVPSEAGAPRGQSPGLPEHESPAQQLLIAQC